MTISSPAAGAMLVDAGTNTLRIAASSTGGITTSSPVSTGALTAPTLSLGGLALWRQFTGDANYSAIYGSSVTPGVLNFSLAARADGTTTTLNSTAYTNLGVNCATVASATSTAFTIAATDTLKATYASLGASGTVTMSGGMIEPSGTNVTSASATIPSTAPKVVRVNYNTGACTITLPGAPAAGQEFVFINLGTAPAATIIFTSPISGGIYSPQSATSVTTTSAIPYTTSRYIRAWSTGNSWIIGY